MADFKGSSRQSARTVTVLLACITPMTMSSCVAVDVDGYSDNPNYSVTQQKNVKKVIEISPGVLNITQN